MPRWVVLLLAAALGVAAEIPPPWRAALERITPASLAGHVSFLASDALEGRDTPSKGLEVAAEYIASRFRAAGLEPAGDVGYFQTAPWIVREQPVHIEVSLKGPARVIRPAAARIGIVADEAGRYEIRRCIVMELGERLDPGKAAGAVAVAVVPADESRRTLFRRYVRLRRALAENPPAALLLAERDALFLGRLRRPRLVDPEEPPKEEFPVVAVNDADFAAELSAARRAGRRPEIAAVWSDPLERRVTLRNVVAVIRGRDPALRDTAVMISAHYDHIGVKRAGEGDRIFNGANDDASGVAAMLEIAEALAELPQRPRRSILFVAFFGEERGGLGSKHYVRHPVIPLESTVADINLEHLGRTDSDEGPQRRRLAVTGFELSNVAETLERAGGETGVTVYRHEKYSGPFFSRSDNMALATRGVPAHSVSVTFYFPDYHGVGDHWDKIDYDNMAAVTRTIALGALELAESREAPRWNPESTKAGPFREAREESAAAGGR